MALHHAGPGQPIEIPPLETAAGERITRALFKTSELEVMRLVVLKGKKIPAHQVAHTAILHCLEGRALLTAMGQTQELRPAHLVHLPGGESHSLEALEDASILVTIVR